MTPDSMALISAALRELTANFRSMFEKWKLIVDSEQFWILAISQEVFPRKLHNRACFSFSVSRADDEFSRPIATAPAEESCS